MKFKSLDEQWKEISRNIFCSDKSRKDFEYIFYCGAAAYQNVLAYINENVTDADKGVDIVEKISEELSKRLFELI